MQSAVLDRTISTQETEETRDERSQGFQTVVPGNDAYEYAARV